MRTRSIAVLLCVIGLLGTLLTVSACGSLPENAAASVNGTIITKDAVEKRANDLRNVYGAMVPGANEGDYYTNFIRETTDQLVREELERQEAEKRGISVSAEEVETRYQEIADESFLGDVQRMKDDYMSRGLTEEDMYRDTERAILHEKVMADLGKEITVTDDDARAYYERNIGQYVQPERRQVRQIVTDDEAKALEAASKARAGEPFLGLVDQYSIDEANKSKKGALGLVSPGQLAPELDKAVYAMNLSQVSDPIRVGQQWYILTVESILQPVNVPFEDVKDEIKALYGNQQFSERWRAFVQEVYDESSIEFAPEYDPDFRVEIEGQQ